MASRYYGIARVLEVARRIGPATDKMVFVKNDEVLVGIVRGSRYAIAADLTDPREYQTFYRACQKGEWLDIDLYRMPRREAEGSPDQGRMTLAELEKFLSRRRGRKEKQH